MPHLARIAALWALAFPLAAQDCSFSNFGGNMCMPEDALWENWTIPRCYTYSCVPAKSAVLVDGLVESNGELFVEAPLIRILPHFRVEKGGTAIIRATQ